MSWIGVVVVVVLVGSMIGAGMLVDHRRYRGIPVSPGLSLNPPIALVGRSARVDLGAGCPISRLGRVELPVGPASPGS